MSPLGIIVKCDPSLCIAMGIKWMSESNCAATLTDLFIILASLESYNPSIVNAPSSNS